MSGLDVADQHMAQARTHVAAVPAPDVVRMALGPSPGSNERLEQRKPLLPGELVESQAGRNDTLAAVSAREDRPCLSYGSALTARVEPPSTLPPVDVAETLAQAGAYRLKRDDHVRPEPNRIVVRGLEREPAEARSVGGSPLREKVWVPVIRIPRFCALAVRGWVG